MLCYDQSKETNPDMIPAFTERGLLPPGIHRATLDEIETRLATTPRRRKLMAGLREALHNLKLAGVARVYINGSFVTSKPNPNDIDGCWDATRRVDASRIDPVLLDFTNSRSAMRTRYGVDFFVADAVERSSGVPFVAFFQRTVDGDMKGILLVDLRKEDL
jgi:hypothetical protein